MAALETPLAQIGFKAPDFTLTGTDGRTYSIGDVRGEKGLVVAFICNHCPYVKAQLDRIIEDAALLKEHGVGFIAINANDTKEYPEDSLDNMRRLAQEKAFPFPYVIDETQAVAHAYNAVCTPDFFGFNTNMELEYRGRLDQSWSNAVAGTTRELREAMIQIAKTGKGPAEQSPSIGCSIKWRQESAVEAAG